MEMNISLPKICIGLDVLSNLNKAIQLEWLVTNGLGGYASSTVLGINTRKYHGLLVAAFNPPTDRRVLLTKLDEVVQIGNRTYQVGANEFKSGIQPEGYNFLSSFDLHPFPTFTYIVDNLHLQKTVFMPHEKNATIVIYEASNPHEEKAFIHIKPLLNSRHFHAITEKGSLTWDFIQKPFEKGITVQPSNQLSALILLSSDGCYRAGKGEWMETYYRIDDSRGESSLDDNYLPGFFEVDVGPNQTRRFYVVAAAGKNESAAQKVFSSLYSGEPKSIEFLYNMELGRRKNLLRKFQERHTSVQMEEWLKWLVLAADSFIAHRQSTKKKSVIAGYHWFEDWGRDSLISLLGLTLVTGRSEEAREILLTFKQYCQNGIIPNRFPDHTADKPDYNTVDATLWYFNAVLQYLKYTNDFNFVRGELWDVLKDIVENHVRGTIYNIRMDADGLIMHGPQLTWMDAKIDEKFVTPREGKAVEIQALWYNALKIMQLLATSFNQKEEAEKYLVMAEKAKKSFLESFWNPQRGCLLDVVYHGQKDSSLRPNQVIAASLDFSMLDKAIGEKVVGTVWERLWGTYGLKTLSNDDPRYVGKYQGNRYQRDTAYHNGTVWAWLLGPFTTAFLKLKNHKEEWRNFAFQNFLQPLFQHETFRAGLGTISEIFDGDPPHMPNGCIAQAWSVAEPLRAFMEDVMLRRPPYEQQILKNF